jgi:predicted dehydrogenase
MSANGSIDDVTRREFVAGVGLTGAGVATGLSFFFSKPTVPQPKKDAVRVGFIGVGARGGALLQAMLKVPGSEVVAVCDMRSEKRQQAEANVVREAKASGRGEVKVFKTDDYHKLLKDGGVDAVVIATPHYLHGPMAMDALEAGKHVYCEKAMAFTIGECIDLYRMCKERPKQVFQVGHQRHYSKMYRKVRELVLGGRIGNVVGIRAQWNRNDEIRRPVDDPELDRLVNWRLFSEYSGGLMSEFASHQIDVANMMLETHPHSICGMGGQDYPRYKDDRDTTDNVQLVFNYLADWREDRSKGIDPATGKEDWDFVRTGKKYPVRFSYMSIMTNSLLGPSEMIFGDEGAIEVTLGGGDFWKEAKMLRSPKKIAQGTNSERTHQKEILLTGSTVTAVEKGTRPPDEAVETPKEKTDWTQFVTLQGEHSPQETLLALDSFLDCVRRYDQPEYLAEHLRANVKVGVWGAAPCIMANIAMRESRTVHWEEFFDGDLS